MKKFTLLQLFSIVDGRLSTNMDDIYDMFNHIFNKSHFTHELPTAFNNLKSLNPQWYQDLTKKLNDIKLIHGNDFDRLIKVIELNNEEIEIPSV